MCYSDYDGDELCATVVVDTWNPAGVNMPTVFSTPQSILAAVDDLAIQFNKEVNLCMCHFLPALIQPPLPPFCLCVCLRTFAQCMPV